jgi:hypothetical protein
VALVRLEKPPWFAVEVKLSDISVSPSLHYFKERLNIPYLFQVVKRPGGDRLINGVRVISDSRFLTALI